MTETDKKIRIEVLTNNIKSLRYDLPRIEEMDKYFKAWEYATKPVYLTRDEAVKYSYLVREFINIKTLELQGYEDEINILNSTSYEEQKKSEK